MTTRSPRRSGRPSAPSPERDRDGGHAAGPARTVFVGSGAFAVPALRGLLAASELVDLTGVVTAPQRPSGRGQRIAASPVDVVASEARLEPILRPQRLRRPEAVAEVLALRPDLIVLADYGQIVPAALLGLPLGALNLHPSLLPRHRGATPVPATILAGDARTGVSLMQMDAGLDTGHLVAVHEIALAGNETTPELEARLAADGAVLLAANLRAWIRGEIEPRPQATEGATLTRPLRRADGRLDPALAAERLERQVRAYQPWPGSWLETDAGRLTVWSAAVRPAGAGGTAAPGELVRMASGGLALATGDSLLELVEVQLAGGRRMTADELLRGRPGLAGSRVHEGPMEPVG